MRSKKSLGILAMTIVSLGQIPALQAQDIGDVIAGAVSPASKPKLSARAKALTEKLSRLAVTEAGLELETLRNEIAAEQRAINREELVRRIGNNAHGGWQEFARTVQKRETRFKPMGLENGDKIKTQAQLEDYLVKMTGSKTIDPTLYKLNAESGIWEEDLIKIPNEALSFKNAKENYLGANVIADLIEERMTSGKPMDEAFVKEMSERVHDEWSIRAIRGYEPEFGASLKAPIDYSQLLSTDAGKAAMERIKAKDAWTFGNIKPFADLDDNTKFLDTIFAKAGQEEFTTEARLVAARKNLLGDLRIAAAAEARALDANGGKAVAKVINAEDEALIRELQVAIREGKGSTALVEKAGKSRILGQILRGGITAAALTGIVVRAVDAKDAATGSRTTYDPRGVLGVGDGR